MEHLHNFAWFGILSRLLLINVWATQLVILRFWPVLLDEANCCLEDLARILELELRCIAGDFDR